MGNLLSLVLGLLTATAQAQCNPDTAVARVNGQKVTLSYFRYVESTIPKWALRKYYGGQEGKRELLKKILQRTLILVDAQKRGLFDREPFRGEVERFKVKRLAYAYINEKLKGIKVTEEELERALKNYPKKELTEARIKSIKASLLADKFVKERQELLSRVKNEIEMVNPSPKGPSEVVGKFRGREITYREIAPLIEGKPTKKKIEKALVTYALYTLALKEGLNAREEFLNSLRVFKERLAVKEFEGEILKEAKVSDREVKEYYEAHRDKFRGPGSAKVRIFVFRDLKGAEASLKALRRGEEVKKAVPGEVLRGAKEWSVSSGDRENPVALLVFKSKERYNLLKMPDGRVLLIETLKKKPPRLLPYGDAYSKVKEKLLRERVRELFRERMEKLKERYGQELYKESLRCLGE